MENHDTFNDLEKTTGDNPITRLLLQSQHLPYQIVLLLALFVPIFLGLAIYRFRKPTPGTGSKYTQHWRHAADTERASRTDSYRYRNKNVTGDGVKHEDIAQNQDVVGPESGPSNPPTHPNNTLTSIIPNSTPPTPLLKCATEYTFCANIARNISLNCIGNRIYRFTPGQTLTVSIDWAHFKHLPDVERAERRRLLQHGLQFTLETINRLNLGIEFEYINGNQRGFVELVYKESKTKQSDDGQVYTTWARSSFPAPGVKQYTVKVYETTFETRYCSSIPNILSHEFTHLLSCGTGTPM